MGGWRELVSIMNKQQRLAMVLSLVLGGVAVGTAIEQAGSTQDDVDGAVIEAAVALRDIGIDVADIPTEVARATGVDVATVQPLVDRATLGEGRDPRALRSRTLIMLVPVDDAPAAAAAFAQAVCEPLELAPDLYTRCLGVDHFGTGRAVCAQGVPPQTHAVVEITATPGIDERVREIVMQATFLDDADDIDARDLWWCGETRPATLDPT